MVQSGEGFHSVGLKLNGKAVLLIVCPGAVPHLAKKPEDWALYLMFKLSYTTAKGLYDPQ